MASAFQITSGYPPAASKVPVMTKDMDNSVAFYLILIQETEYGAHAKVYAGHFVISTEGRNLFFPASYILKISRWARNDTNLRFFRSPYNIGYL
jgi:hypothetical protein